jgi:chemotaxis protein CheD
MNHFMLPEESPFEDEPYAETLNRQETRYGSYAMESLINDLLKLGATRERLEIKVFGGGRILASMTDIGARNIAFIRQYLSTEGLGVCAQDLGGDRPRKVVYFPTTGRARMKTLRPIENRSIADREQLYLARLRREQDGGDIELFA